MPPCRTFPAFLPDFSAALAGLKDIFGNLCEGKPKAIYYRPIQPSRASIVGIFLNGMETVKELNDRCNNALPFGRVNWCGKNIAKNRHFDVV